MTCLIVILAATQAHAQFSIRAASATPVEGWERMQVEHCQGPRCVVWVSPVAAIVASDIEQAQPEVRHDGDTIISVVFTDVGVSKLHALTAAQFKKPIAMVVDGKLIWAPMVMYIADEIAKNNVLTGSGPHGLTQEEVQQIMASLH
jgi:preprotein translocase subunit SecD